MSQTPKTSLWDTVPFQSIRQSRVTGLPKSMKCHDCHGHFSEVTKSFGDHMPNIEIFVHVTAKLGGCRNHIFVRCVTHHGTWWIDWNGTVAFCQNYSLYEAWELFKTPLDRHHQLFYLLHLFITLLIIALSFV